MVVSGTLPDPEAVDLADRLRGDNEAADSVGAGRRDPKPRARGRVGESSPTSPRAVVHSTGWSSLLACRSEKTGPTWRRGPTARSRSLVTPSVSHCVPDMRAALRPFGLPPLELPPPIAVGWWREVARNPLPLLPGILGDAVIGPGQWEEAPEFRAAAPPQTSNGNHGTALAAYRLLTAPLFPESRITSPPRRTQVLRGID